MKNIYKYFILFFILIDLFAKEPLQKVTLQLKWKNQFQFAGFLMAKEKGFYKEMGLDVHIKEFDGKINIIEDILNENTQFAISDSSLIYEVLKGKPLVAMMAIFQDTPRVLIGLKSSNIKELKDIDGAKIALYNGIGGISIKTMLKNNNINYIPKPPAFKLDRLISGEVDLMMSYISNEPFIAQQKGLDIVTFLPHDYGSEAYGDILFTSKKLLKQDPELIRKMYKASYRGWLYAFENLDEAVDIIYKKYNTLNKSYKAMQYEADTLKQLSGFNNNFGKLDKQKIKGIAQQFNILKGEYNKLNVLDNFIYDVNEKVSELKTVNVLLGFDKPPFIFGKTSLKGIDADHLIEAFKLVGYKVNIFQGTKDKQESILHKNQSHIDAVATITQKDDGLFYSDTFSTYENYVITRQKDNLQIKSLEDLKNIKFVTWKTAYNDLGKAFYYLFNPLTGKYKESYHDTSSQEEDAKMFFSKKADAIIVDKAIFKWYKLHFNNDEKYTFHDILQNKKKEYPVTFKDKKIRDDFNIGMQKLKQSGRFDEIIEFYATQNVEELLTFANLLSNISSNYLFEDKKSKLKNILTYFFNHPDIKAISIKKKDQKEYYLKLIKTNRRIIVDNTYDFTNLQSISKKIYFNEQNELLELGELRIHYTHNYGTKNGNLLPSLKVLKALDSEEYNLIEKTYKKYNINSNATFNIPLKKTTIKVCYPKDMEPLIFEYDGKPVGIAKEYLNIIAKNMNIDFEYIFANTIKQHHEMIKSNKCDIVPVIVNNPNQFDFLIPSKEYIEDYIALATAIHQPYEMNMENLENKKIGVNAELKNILSYLEQEYPKIKFIKIKKDGLKKVKKGELYGYIEPAFMLSYKILKFHHNDLKIMRSVSNNRLQGAIGINKNKAYLLPLLNKGIENITAKEHNNILSNWKKLKYDKEIDYTYVWYTVDIFIVIFLIVFIAYIKQNKLKKKIEIEKDKFENIFNNAKDGMLILKNNKFTDYNRSIIEILGYKEKNELLDLNLIKLSPEYQPNGQKSAQKFEKIIDTTIKKGYFNFEWKYIKADNIESWGDITFTNISTNDDFILHVVWRDISEKKRLQNELEEINLTLKDRVKNEVEKNKKQQLMIIQQSRLAQMGEMISMIAHQWRQPLNNLSILNNTIVLKYSKNKLDDEVIERYKDNSKKQIQLMSKTIDDFRNFFKPNKQKTSFEIHSIIENTFDILKPLFIKHNIIYKLDYKDVIRVQGYPNELGQALLNILSNSIDALLENKIQNKQIDIKLYKDKEFVYIELLDNARGIPEDILDRVFDPYFSTKNEKNGTGLGLYMTKMIIEEQMNGKIDVSNEQSGALFHIRLNLDLS